MASLICIFLVCLMVTACSKKADTLFIVAADGLTTKGKVKIDLDPNTGQPNIKFFVPGTIYVFRIDKELKGLDCKAGFAYRVNKDEKLELIGSVDLSLSDEQLEKKFLK